jgi:hypothetical protein
MNLAYIEPLPTAEAVTGPHAAAHAAAAHQELAEVRALLRTPSPLLNSPRIQRRYHDALKWAALYPKDTK